MASVPIAGVDHVGLLVHDIDASLSYFTDQLGFTLRSDEFTSASGGARLAYLDAVNFTIQLLSPTSSNGPIADHLAQKGEGLHHICLAVDDIEMTVNSLAPESNVPIVVGGRGRRTAFLPDRPSGVVIELTETAVHGFEDGD